MTSFATANATASPTMTIQLDNSGALPASFSAAGFAVSFRESAHLSNTSRITGFGTDDEIVVSSAYNKYEFANVGGDLVISSKQFGATNTITLVGAIAANAVVTDEASAEAALGADFFSYRGIGFSLAGSQTLSATELGSSFTARSTQSNVTTITDFAADDRIIVDAPSRYAFSNDRGTLVISSKSGLPSHIKLVNAVDPAAVIVDEASAEAAIGTNFFRSLAPPANLAPSVGIAGGVVPENISTTTEVLRATARDPEGQAVTFSISGPDAPRFRIDAVTGVVTFRESPDFEATPRKTEFQLQITATDSDGAASSPVNALVFLTNVNEAPRFATATRAISVARTLDAGEPVIASGGAVDPDVSLPPRYSLTGPDAAAFLVYDDTGAVIFAQPPELRTKSTYNFNLVATDLGQLSGTQAVTVTLTDTAPAPTPSFFLLVPTATSAIAQGTGTVFGVIDRPQEVVVRDAPGTITFDGSFNGGGDRIVLAGPAANYTAMRSGSTLVISDGDTTVFVPIGARGGAEIVFGDGARSTFFDVNARMMRLGSQTLTTEPVTITSPAEPARFDFETNPAFGSQLLVNGGQSAAAFGRAMVFGTAAGAETVTVAAGAKLTFDGSFNAGGDTIVLPGARSAWTASHQGATVMLTGAGGESISLPTGPNATTLRFADGDRSLFIDLQAGAIKLGGTALSTTPAPVMDAGPAADFATFVI